MGRRTNVRRPTGVSLRPFLGRGTARHGKGTGRDGTGRDVAGQGRRGARMPRPVGGLGGCQRLDGLDGLERERLDGLRAAGCGLRTAGLGGLGLEGSAGDTGTRRAGARYVPEHDSPR
ncbi:hypothetical protein SSP531S_16190 [Streptomyces spongiicola]|uniref:Uncharacterized protein n=1 Tax=Streptomyces spongiicola TaxID=1690221 RepID=A0A388SYZ6_9ACTN|nr:hypothetical protein SSP531S_16190 [Streptomyces spongiicola]